jgi:8-amino-7-oxononanoate synthase
MAIPFLQRQGKRLEKRFGEDDPTRLRLKYEPYYHTFNKQVGSRVWQDDREYIMLASNDYLGLGNHPLVIEAGKKALDEWGSGTTGARLANGSRSFHLELEEELADFLGKEACQISSAGYLSCMSAVASFATRGDMIFVDKNSHSSLWSGIQASGASYEKFSHNNADDLRHLLSTEKPEKTKIIVIEGVYSMEGHIAKLPEIVALAEEFDAFLLMDDAHGFGVLGQNGRGTVEHFEMENGVDAICGSFSKSLGGTGGFVAASRDAIEYLRSHSKQTIFSAAVSPVATACAKTVLGIMKEEPEHRHRLWENVRKYKAILADLELDTWESETPAVPIVLGDKEKVYFFWKALMEKAIFTVISVAPAVPPGKDLIRTAISARHTEEDLERIGDALAYAKSQCRL